MPCYLLHQPLRYDCPSPDPQPTLGQIDSLGA
jgi:hypothetical protein